MQVMADGACQHMEVSQDSLILFSGSFLKVRVHLVLISCSKRVSISMPERGLPGLKKWPYTEAGAPFFQGSEHKRFLGEERRWLKAEHASSTWCVQAKKTMWG